MPNGNSTGGIGAKTSELRDNFIRIFKALPHTARVSIVRRPLLWCGLVAGIALPVALLVQPADASALIVAALTLLGTAAAVLTQRWNQKKATMEFMHEWDQDALALALQRVEKISEKGLKTSRPGCPTTLTAIDLTFINNVPGNRQAVIVVLNHLQKVCIGTEKQVFDEEMMYALYGFSVVSYYARLRPFIDAWRESERKAGNDDHNRKDGGKAWPTLDAVAHRWGTRMYANWDMLMTQAEAKVEPMATGAQSLSLKASLSQT